MTEQGAAKRLHFHSYHPHSEELLKDVVPTYLPTLDDIFPRGRVKPLSWWLKTDLSSNFDPAQDLRRVAAARMEVADAHSHCND